MQTFQQSTNQFLFCLFMFGCERFRNSRAARVRRRHSLRHVCGQGFSPSPLYRLSERITLSVTSVICIYVCSMDCSVVSQRRRRASSPTSISRLIGALVLLGGILFLGVKSLPTSSEYTKVQVASTFQEVLLNRHARATIDDCSTNETVTPEGGTLSSPGYPDRYPSNCDCRWLLIAPDDTNIVLRIRSLNLEKGRECELDYLQIHLGATSLSPITEKLCGVIKDKVIFTNTSTVLLIFHSDPSYEDQGFSIDYYLQAVEGCPVTLTEASGTISSPNFPANYPDNTDCWTLISVANEKKILLQFDTIDLEFDENCTYDYIQVYDGSSKDAFSFGRFCSSNQKVPLHSTSNELLVHFHSDHLVNKKGFKALYTTTSLNGININDLGGCLWESESNNGSIASPNYPQKYPSNSDCKMQIIAPENEVITIVFDTLQLEVDTNCSYDYLEIRDGTDKGSTNIHRFCGNSEEPKTLTSSHNSLLITFHSDDFAEFSGFKAKYWFHGSDNASEIETTAEDESFTMESIPLANRDDIFIEKPQNLTLTIGLPYMLQCAVSDPVAKIRWLKDDQFLGGNTPLPGLKLVANNTLWIQSANKQLAGVYTCAAVTPEKTHYAKAWLKLENDGLLADTVCSIVLRKTPRNSTFTEGEFAHMECLAAGNQVQVHWEKDGLPLESKDHITVLRNGFLFIDKVTLQDAGEYTCITKDLTSGCQKKVSVILTVNGKAKLMEICGQPKVGQPSKIKPHLEHGKIVGGFNTRKGSYPWQVMLWEPHLKSYCGGSLINERWIITAAHCLRSYKGLRLDDIIIKLGKYNREVEEPEEVRTVIAEPSAVVVHPAYNKANFDNDIAMIRLRDHIKFTDYILPVCLGSWELFEDNDTGRSAIKVGTVTGWGRLKESGPSPKYLQEIQLPIVDQRTCINSTSFPVTRNMFCAGYSQEILGDACNGDSGGPFVVYHENRWYLLGIVSWGEGCGQANKYGFYTKVTNYLPWIKGIMKS